MVLLVLFYLLAPFLVLHLCHRFKYVNKLGAVVVAYVLGVLLGNSGWLPEGSAKVQEIMTAATIPLAIPLMLFSTRLNEVFKLARVSLVSLLLDRKSTRLNSSHVRISYAVFCLKKKKKY